MELKVLRQVFTRNSTIGQLFVNGQFECFTLEDMVRPNKIFGETAIPAGTYQVVISMSPRFKRRLPLLVDVPEYSGVRIHPGNKAADTEGCILVGQTKSTDFIGASQAAFGVLMPKLEAAAKNEHITIEIVNDGTPVGTAPAGAARAPARRAKPVVLGTPYKAPVGAAKKAPARKTAAKKSPAKKAAAPAKPSPGAAAVKKAAAKQAPAKQAPVKKAPARKAAAPKPAASRTAKKGG